MKIRIFLTIIITFLILLSTSVLAYNGDGWSIDINEEEYDKLSQEGTTIFQKSNGNSILVQKVEQNLFGGKLTQYQLNMITQMEAEQYKQIYNATLEETERTEIQVNDYTVSKMKYKLEAGESVMYQDLNIFLTDNCLYYITFTSGSENGFSNDEITTILNSFKIIKDTKNEENTNTSTENINTDNTKTENTTANQDNVLLFQVIVIALLVVLIITVIIVGVLLLKKNKTSN